MKKGEIRREFFKLRLEQKSYSKCRILLQERYKYSVSIRTLKRWQQRFSYDDAWNLQDDSTKPRKIYSKVNSRVIEEIIQLRKRTNWGASKLKVMLPHLNLSHQRINSLLQEQGLTRKDHNRGKRAKYILNLVRKGKLLQSLMTAQDTVWESYM